MVTKQNPDYASFASSEQPTVVEGFVVGDSYVRVVVDDKDDHGNHNHGPHSGCGNLARCNQRSNKSLGLEKDPAFNGSRKPVMLAFCPNCSVEHVRTRTKTYPSFVTWACVAVGAAIFFPICWIPLVVDNMKQTDHYCQNCGQKLARVKPLEGVCVTEQN